MALVKHDTFRDMEDFFDRYFRNAGLPVSMGREAITGGDWSPRVDISETNNEFLIKAELPDVMKDDMHVSVDNGVLTLRGEKKQEKEEKGKKYHRVERHYGSFSRSFSLPENVDANAIKATFRDGVLNVTLPKTAKKSAKAIKVNVA
ncbi:MAG: Hsp20/alpha crystallin family protein [Azoarcus sp.]|nr:Hsp20/alpha crystallin family protein [Azoarcus sp.]